MARKLNRFFEFTSHGWGRVRAAFGEACRVVMLKNACFAVFLI